MIWLGRTQGGAHRYSGMTERGRLINALTLDMENSRANEERIYRLRELLAAAGPRIASIGSGCGIEFWDMPKVEVTRRDILLVDKDSAALAHARERLPPRPDWIVTYCEDNVLKFALRDAAAERQSRDLVYSFGLLDYFPLHAAKRIVHGLWQYVAPGGSLVLTNAHPCNPTRLWMEYGSQWFLDYKDEASMRALADGLPRTTATTYSPDSFGIYQYLQVCA